MFRACTWLFDSGQPLRWCKLHYFYPLSFFYNLTERFIQHRRGTPAAKQQAGAAGVIREESAQLVVVANRLVGRVLGEGWGWRVGGREQDRSRRCFLLPPPAACDPVLFE